jgi:type IV secretory pathway VirB10-like protein
MSDEGKTTKKGIPKGISFNMTGGRWFVLGVGLMGSFIGFVTYSVYQRDHGGINGSAHVAESTSPMQNIAGSPDASPKYVAEVKSMNANGANAAASSGSPAFVSTPVIDPSGRKSFDNSPPEQSQKPEPAQAQVAQPQPPESYQRPQPDQAISAQIQQLANALNGMRSGQTNVVYTTNAVTAPPVDNAGAHVATVGANQPVPESILPAGSLIYGVFETRLQSDVPGPVLGNLVQGKWDGYKVLGKFENISGSNLLAIHLTKLVAPDKTVHTIDAYALSPDTTLPAMATDVDRHVLARVRSSTSSFAVSMMIGYGQALAQGGATMVSGYGGSVTSYPVMSTKQLLGVAAGAAAQGLQAPEQVLAANIVQPNTITVKEGTPFVLLTVQGANKK